VTSIAQRALRRAGLTVPRFGAHVFRHTVATQCVQRGVSMKVVADLLGHADLETTALYAKLDVATLAAVALPWPEGAR
jgi:integrase/recombinase XerD